MKISEEVQRFGYHYPQIAAVITARANGRANAMTAAWQTPVSSRPPLYGVAISPKRFTYSLILKSGEFAVNFLPWEKAELVAAVGGSKGEKIDKFKSFGIEEEEPIKTGAPILKCAYGAYECRLVSDQAYGDHRFIIGEVLAVHYLEDAFSDEGIINLDKVRPVLYVGLDSYVDINTPKVVAIDRLKAIRYLEEEHD